MLCSKCDADIGTGLNPNGGICLGFCEKWYQSCVDELIDPYVEQNERIPFCSSDSMICSPVNVVFKEANEFCSYLGFNVIDDKPPASD